MEKEKYHPLADEFSIIKTNLVKIREIFDILERDFRVRKDDLNIDKYRDLIMKIEDILPKRKITKFGKNYRIGCNPAF